MDIYNSAQTTQRSFLLASQQQQFALNSSTLITSTLQTTLSNADTITAQLQGQLQQVRNQRYVPYQPYVPTVLPSSVLELQRKTANAGVPMSVFTIANCRGSQFVTK